MRIQWVTGDNTYVLTVSPDYCASVVASLNLATCAAVLAMATVNFFERL